MKTNQTIGQVAEALKSGLTARRPHMTDAVIFRQVPSHVPQHIVEKMTSLPNAVKVTVIAKNEGIYYKDQVAIVRDGHQASAYTFSVEDVFAEDWIIDDGDTTEQLPGFAVAGETVGTATPT